MMTCKKKSLTLRKLSAFLTTMYKKNAIKEALKSKVFILTGGPGTGKTTVINGLIAAYADLHQIDLEKKEIPIILAAPTGRAAAV